MTVRRITRNKDFSRVETGAIRFEDDWPGIFIRGDDCMRLRMVLEELHLEPYPQVVIDELLQAIKDAHGRSK